MAERRVGKFDVVQSSYVLVEPLSSSENLNPVQTLHDIVRTCYGPRGCLKAIQNKDGGKADITSSSSVLFHRISPSNPFVKLIFACVKSHLKKHNDFGLLTALTVTTLLLSSLSLDVPKVLVAELNDHLVKLCFEYFDCEQCPSKIRLQLDSVSQLLSVIRTVLNSKPACVLNKDEKNHLALLLLKTFLNVVPDKSDKIGRVEIITHEGVSASNSDVFSGLLIPCQSSTETICDKSDKKDLKLILFAISLSGDAEFSVDTLEVHEDVSVWNEVLCHLSNLCNKIIDKRIDVVACQKVVHPLLREKLENAGILVLDRLGFDITQAVQDLTKASPMQNIFLPEDMNIYGHITSVQIKKIDKKSYVNFQSSDSVWTLLICHNIESALNETKIVCRQAIDTLYKLIAGNYLLFGAGCTETSLAAHLYKVINNTVEDICQVFRCSNEQVLIVTENFLSVLCDIAVNVHSGKKCDFKLDNKYGHLWNSTNDACMCGQFLKAELPSAKWTYLNSPNFNINENIKPLLEIKKDILLDEFTGKKQAYSAAFEIASLLLKTSICIIDKN